MSFISKIKQYIWKSPYTIDSVISFLHRRKFGKEELQKSLPNARKINLEQKQLIQNFWSPYLTSLKKRSVFDFEWFDVYNRTNVFGFKLEHYIPDGFYYSIVDRSLTNSLDAKKLDDKNLYDLYFNDVNQPTTIVRKMKGTYLDHEYNIISEDEAINRCVANGKVIIKPSLGTAAGEGIVFWNAKENSTEQLCLTLRRVDNIIIQDLIRQHDFLASFTDSCVNTMRIVTLVWDSTVSITSSVLIMGGPSSKTNHLHSGGIVCGILPDGSLRDTAFDGLLNEYKEHPNGLRFGELKIPNYEKCVSLVKKLAPRMSGISKLLNWDITIDENGNPLLIEVNLTWGGTVQIAAGPVFGDKTPEILAYVVKNGDWK